MDCEEIRKWISDDLGGEAPPEQAERVREHLASCPECRALRRAWERIDRAVKEAPADAPDESYWEEFPVRLAPRLGLQPPRVVRLGRPVSWGWAVAATLLVALCVAVYVAADQSRRASEAAVRLAALTAHPALTPAIPIVPAAAQETTVTDMKLFHELDLTFEGGVKWVATDGHKIDFGVSRELGPTPAAVQGPDRVAAVVVSVRRVDGRQGSLVDQARIVGRSGCRADFTVQTGGLEFNYQCLPVIGSGESARLQLSVGVGRPDTDGYGAASAAVSLRSGQSAEVGRVVSDGFTYSIDVSISVLPVKGHYTGTGA